jgi:hypothetical protein
LGVTKSHEGTKASNSAVGNQGPSTGAIAHGQTFTGRLIRNEEALKLADSVIVGRIVEVGERDLGGPGQVYYGNVKVEVVQTIKGRIYKTVTLSLKVQTDPEEEFEQIPTIGDRYILFLKKLNPKDTRGIKLIEATEENLTTIVALARATAVKN